MTCHPVVPAKSSGQSHILAAFVRLHGVSLLVCMAGCASGVIGPDRALTDAPPTIDGAIDVDAAVDGTDIVGDDAAVDAMLGCQEDPATYTPFAGSGPYR